MSEAELLAQLLGNNRAWPLKDTILRLRKAAKHLLEYHDCDHEGYEQVLVALNESIYYLHMIDISNRRNSL